MLEKHDWPGNVRELRNVVQRAVLMRNADTLTTVEDVVFPAEHCANHWPLKGVMGGSTSRP